MSVQQISESAQTTLMAFFWFTLPLIYLHDENQRQDKVAQFNDELTLALLRATQGQFHYCGQLVELQNKTVGRRKKRVVWFFGPAIALVIAAIAIENEASKVPKCPPGFVIYGKHCITEGGSDTCP